MARRRLRNAGVPSSTLLSVSVGIRPRRHAALLNLRRGGPFHVHTEYCERGGYASVTDLHKTMYRRVPRSRPCARVCMSRLNVVEGSLKLFCTDSVDFRLAALQTACMQ